MKKKFSILLFFAVLLFLTGCVTTELETEQIPEYSFKEVRVTLENGVELSEINNGSKEIKYACHITLVDESGNVEDYSDCEMKGRGNYTWNNSEMVKKPYQIKFSSKVDVFGLGSAKKWVLLANYADGTLMKNKLVLDLADKIGMPYSSDSEWVDLYVNGEYAGNYLLCEKVEVGKNRVNLKSEYGILAELDNVYGTEEDLYYIT